MKKQTLLSLILIAMLIAPLASACASAPTTETYTVGIVSPAASMEAVIAGIKEGMAEYGYSEGENITYIYNGPKTGEALTEEANALVTAKVDVLIGLATPGALAAQKAVAGTDIPVVYAPISDPVGVGLADRITVPGKNMTGVKSADFVPKEFEWLMIIVPTVKKVFAPYNPSDGGAVYGYNLLVDAAQKLNIELVTPKIGNAAEVQSALDEMPEDIDAIFMLTDSLILSNIDAFVATSVEKGLPLTSINDTQVEAGALLAYGPEFGSVGRQTAHLVDQVLQGADPSILPIEDATYYLYVNQKVANDLGIVIPDEVLKAAEGIIR